MEPFRRLTALACPLPLANVDTDQIIPARFMKRPRNDGYGDVLLHDLRFDQGGAPRPEMPLNRPERRGAKILVARRNFGSGSSREAAAYALVDHGFRCVVAPSFGDIYANNAVNNGLLSVVLAEEVVEALLHWLEAGGRDISVDLEACRLAATGIEAGFEIDPVWRTKLLNGWSDIDLTISYGEQIAAFAVADARRRPWMPPSSAEA
jgi:3-isopropylmalate/(R)-2-methylmalate dehydratase small subunit